MRRVALFPCSNLAENVDTIELLLTGSEKISRVKKMLDSRKKKEGRDYRITIDNNPFAFCTRESLGVIYKTCL